MKRSTWQSRKSLLTDRLPNLRLSLLVIASTVVATVASCQLTHSGNRVSADGELTPSAEGGAFAVMPKNNEASEPDYGSFLRVVDANDNSRTLIELAVGGCDASAVDVTWRVSMHSSFGPQSLLVLHPRNGAKTAVVRVDKQRFEIPLGDGPVVNELAEACKFYDDNGSERPFVGKAAFKDQVLAWLEAAAPDCEFVGTTAKGWHCRLESAGPVLASRELEGIQSSMIRRWSRQPYILARRLAVSTTLADALSHETLDAKNQALDTLCRLVQHSLDVELPIVMNSRRWRQAVCVKPAPNRLEAASAGLAKALGEIELFRQLFERTSKIGYLTIKIPSGEAPTKTLWVNLQPEKDVSEGLVKETGSLWNGDATSETNGQNNAENTTTAVADQPAFCWHPIFGDSSELLGLARHLTLGREADGVRCLGTPPDRKKTATYMSESLTSETEFVVTNGRSKMLRLPAGRYHYTLQGLPEDPSEWDDAANYGPQTAGIVEWTDRRPRPTIKKW